MIYLIISLFLLAYLIVLYTTSKSVFFKQEPSELDRLRDNMISYLKIIESSTEQILIYKIAFKYFEINKDEFDGATIVKDLIHIKYLDVNAMLHDWMYLKFNVAANPYYKLLADYLYAKEMERTGKGILSWINFSLLTISTIFFTPYVYVIKGKRMSKEDKLMFVDVYEKMLR